MKTYFFINFFLSFLICLAIIIGVKKSRFFKFLLTDHIHSGPQKLHNTVTPRVGGLALMLCFLFTVIWSFIQNETFKIQLLYLFIPVFIVFLSGFLEDITGKFSAKIRMVLLSISAVLFIILLNTTINKVDILFFDNLLNMKIIAVLFTIFAIVGVTNAFNIIDGFNGLASMVAVLILFALGYVSYKVNDYFLIILCVSSIGMILGFFILNYPSGLIFLGDGGAYFIGFVISIISILLVSNNPQVSPWFPLLVCIYPVFEVIFSMYRRIVIKKTSPFKPDTLHLHTIIYKRFVKKFLNGNNDILKRNYITSPFLWVLSCVGIVPGLLWWNNTTMLIISVFCFMLLYTILYKKLLYKKNI